MAKVLKNYVFIRSSAMYPWDKWLDGHAWQLTQGQDFKCNMHSFRKLAVIQARKKGGKLRTQVMEKKIVIQFFPQRKR